MGIFGNLFEEVKGGNKRLQIKDNIESSISEKYKEPYKASVYIKISLKF
jgi:hypothetical protein